MKRTPIDEHVAQLAEVTRQEEQAGSASAPAPKQLAKATASAPPPAETPAATAERKLSSTRSAVSVAHDGNLAFLARMRRRLEEEER